MTNQAELMAWLFLAYLGLPLVIFLLWWLWGLVRRGAKRKPPEAEEAAGDL